MTMNIKVKIDDLEQLNDVSVDSTGRISLGTDLADERVLLAVLPQLILEVGGEDMIKAVDTDGRGRATIGSEFAGDDLHVAIIDTRDDDEEDVERVLGLNNDDEDGDEE